MTHFAIGVRSAPYLADHVFQDMVVLPGSVYVEWALRTQGARILRNVRFRAPVILSGDDALIGVTAGENGHYAFHEAGTGIASEFDIESGAPAPPPTAAFSVEDFAPLDDFYLRLRANGNQYGPEFQLLSSIRTRGGESLAFIRTAENRVIDAAVQLLAPFVMDEGRTFVLRSIERIEVHDFNLPETLRGHATRDGDVRLYDDSGKTYLELFGVALSLLERPQVTRLAIAANFTAEPLEDALRFWGDRLGSRFAAEFTGYDQVFQQLLDPASAFRRNAGGVNAVLISLEDWGAASRHVLAEPGKERAERCFGERPRRVLPNGLEIVHLNGYETDYLYGEIFEEQCYLKHGVGLRDGATVVDIGANIGLFSLFVMSRVAGARIYAFEPAPAVYELLKANLEAYSDSARAFNAGVAEKPGTARFTFYEKSSVFSGFHSDEADDRRAIEAVVRSVLADHSPTDDDIAALTTDRLRAKTQECRLTTVSDLIREERLERIDLLKIDAERSEAAIVQGIAEEDWPKIRQLVIEVHDPSGEAVRRMEALLTARGYQCVVERQALLERAGLCNLYATRRGERAPRYSGLQRTVEDFCAALRSYGEQCYVPLVLCICPRRKDPELDEAEAALHSQVIPNVHTIGSGLLAGRYPVKDYYDPQTHRAARMPYTPQCYAAIGTALVRAVTALKASPYKVIALDCDNTLWKGVCGEDGVDGIELSAGHRALQEFVLRQMQGGMLLCLCSKNNEADALEVFERRADMPLKRDHLVSWRMNWQPKPANLRSLAEELDVGLESFVFIDDNPLECAEMRASCPQVLTLQLPREPESFAAFLGHVWAFDRARATAEDRNRTRMYQQSAERRRYRSQTLSLKEFVRGLALRIDIAAAGEADLARVSQLTLRTNQFNFTTRRRSEAEIREFMQRHGARCMTVRVEDRFGDYGLVGVLMYERAADRYRVDTLLLSCRVLGRGVEHALVSWLGARALEDGKAFVEFGYEATARNRPALEFIQDHFGASLIVPAERLAAVKYDPDPQVALEPEEGAASASGPALRSETIQQIAEELGDTARLFEAIHGSKPAQGAPTLAGLWARVLGRADVGPDENFFEAGGTSLRAVQLVALVRKELDRRLSVVTIFECPTLALLTARLNGKTEKPLDVPAAMLRGQRRRQQQSARTQA